MQDENLPEASTPHPTLDREEPDSVDFMGDRRPASGRASEEDRTGRAEFALRVAPGRLGERKDRAMLRTSSLRDAVAHVRWYRRFAQDSRHAALRKRIRASMKGEGPRRRLRSPGSVWVVSIVRDERDMVDGLIDHHLAQGASGIIVADNCSLDGTRERLEERSADDRRVFVLDDRLPAFEQGAKLGFLARLAWGAGAEWIVPVDADERWTGEFQTLAATLRGSDAAVVQAEIHNAFPLRAAGDADGSPSDSWRVDLAPHPTRHVAFRAHPFIQLSEGSHWVRRPGAIGVGLHVLHLPWRSKDQLKAKVDRGAASLGSTVAVKAGAQVDGHWFEMANHSDDVLQQVWNEISGESTTVMDYGYKPVGPFRRVATTSPGTWHSFLEGSVKCDGDHG